MDDVVLRLRNRLPKSRRSAELYDRLDKLVPNWHALVAMPAFPDWSTFVDSESGNCMANRIQCLLNDPVYADAGLATIFRLFEADASAADSTDVGFVARLFGRAGGAKKRGARSRLSVLAGKYELIRPLGHGGNGVVFLAWSSETETFYAIKTIKSDLLLDTDAREAFRREAALWIGMTPHPSVVRAYYFEEIAPRLYVAMDFVEPDDWGIGPSLADKIEAGRISNHKATRWFLEVAAGLRHAYTSGILAHRDIKPGNILIRRDGIAQVSDFGLSVSLAGLAENGVVNDAACGTPHFMAPEQFLSAAACDQRSDIYSLGVAMYQSLSGGKLPFSPIFVPKDSEGLLRYYGELRRLHESQSPRALQSELWPVIERCLRKRPGDRFSSIEEFGDALSAAAGGALPLLQTFQPESPDAFWAYRDQGNTFLRPGDYERALGYFDRFLAVIADDAARLNRAICLQNLGQHSAALDEFESLAKAGNAEALINSVGCLLKLNRIEVAIERASSAIAVARGEPAAWIALGNAKYAACQWSEATQAYLQAQHLDPADPTPLYNLGLAATQGGVLDLAERAFREFLARALPDDSRRQFALKALGGGHEV